MNTREKPQQLKKARSPPPQQIYKAMQQPQVQRVQLSEASQSIADEKSIQTKLFQDPNNGGVKAVITVKTQSTKASFQTSTKILDRLRGKVAMKLSDKISCLGYGNILQALKDPEVDDLIRGLIIQDKLQVIDQSNTVVFDREIKEELGI